jgi:hypothetical protein
MRVIHKDAVDIHMTTHNLRINVDKMIDAVGDLAVADGVLTVADGV